MAKSSSWAPNAIKTPFTGFPGGKTAGVKKTPGKLGVYSSLHKGKEIFGKDKPSKPIMSKEWNKGFKKGK